MVLDSLNGNYFITNPHSDIYIHPVQYVLAECQDYIDLCICLSHAYFQGAPLKLFNEPYGNCWDLAHSGNSEPQAELVALEPLLDVFNPLPPVGVTLTRLAHLIYFSYPQDLTSLQGQVYVHMCKKALGGFICV